MLHLLKRGHLGHLLIAPTRCCGRPMPLLATLLSLDEAMVVVLQQEYQEQRHHLSHEEQKEDE
jgi:hypothetical protein